MSDHLFRCINRKCKQRNKQQVRAEFKSNTRCSSCKQVMRYDGEQGKLFETAVESSPMANMEQKELLHAVFLVEGSKRSFCTSAPLCHMEYVCLQNGLSRGASIPFLTKRIVEYHKTSTVKFMFWADSYVGSGPSPVYLTMKNNKVEVR